MGTSTSRQHPFTTFLWLICDCESIRISLENSLRLELNFLMATVELSAMTPL
jgi:hypothetical protein